MAAGLVGLLLAAALLAAAGPGGRRIADAGSPLGSSTGAGGAPRIAGRPGAGPPLHVLLTQVGALSRAGLPVGSAWRQAAGIRLDGDLPRREDLLAVATSGVPGRRRGGRGMVRGAPARGRRTAAQEVLRQVLAVEATCSLAADLGAPLAPCLLSVAESLAAAERERADREAALAGPRATARILMALPAVGVLAGSALGADPVGTLLDGGPGTAALCGGVVLLVAGRWWSGLLVRAARSAGEPA